ncbi:MAG: hypothetical protein AAGC44_10465, partial [Planctomycetota bacterium]
MSEQGIKPPVRGVHRATCLAVRASDARLVEYEGVVDPGVRVARYRRTRAVMRGDFRERDVVGWGVRPERHRVWLDGAVIRALCAPVWLAYPGVTLHEAARRLGRHPEALRRWLPMRPGRDKASRAAVGRQTPFGGLGWHTEDAGRGSVRSA